MVGKNAFALLVLLLAASSLTGCTSDGGQTATKDGSGQTGNGNSPDKPKSPVTLTFYDPTAKGLTENFMEQYGNAIQKKFPYITVNYVSSPDTNPEGHIAGMITAGETIDIVMTADQNFHRLIAPFNLQYDISELIKSERFDLSRLDPGAVKAIQALSNGGMYGLPISMNHFALMYNRDLFDRFGQPYPKDGMTWDETYELAKAMTRVENDVQYRGFITQTYNFAWTSQLSLGFVDPKTDKPLYVSDDRWAKFTRNLTRFYEIPGNALKETTFGAVGNLFNKDKVAAMYANFIPSVEIPVNWDVVSLPTFSDLPGVGPQTLLSMAYITSMSKHKEAAFEAVAYLTSDEFQMNISKKALALPITSNADVKKAFAQEAPLLQGKNVRVLLSNKPAPPFAPSPYSRAAAQFYERTMYKLGKGQVDLNTALRESTEEANKEIEKLKSDKK